MVGPVGPTLLTLFPAFPGGVVAIMVGPRWTLRGDPVSVVPPATKKHGVVKAFFC